jgi:hypothetical protein
LPVSARAAAALPIAAPATAPMVAHAMLLILAALDALAGGRLPLGLRPLSLGLSTLLRLALLTTPLGGRPRLLALLLGTGLGLTLASASGLRLLARLTLRLLPTGLAAARPGTLAAPALLLAPAATWCRLRPGLGLRLALRLR